jgi:hypothetical protein
MSAVNVVVRRNKHFTVFFGYENLNERKAWWDELFRIPYVDFRQELAAIASRNYSELQADRLYTTLEAFFDDQHDITQAGDFVLPVDDDDWLCNGICQTIKDHNPTKDFIAWNCRVVSVFKPAPPDYRTLDKIRADISLRVAATGVVDSCCYALRNKAITEVNLIYHTKASQLVPEREYISSAGLESCYIYMPSSQSALCTMITSKEDLKTSVEEVQLLDDRLLANRPEFVANLKRVKELFAAL